MDMDSLAILVKAILSLKDVTDSKKQIASELPKLESQLQSDKKTRVKIIAGLDIAKSKKVIQSQIDSLSSQLNNKTIKVGLEVAKNNGIQNIVGGLKQAEIQAQKTNNNLTNLTDKFKEPIKPILNNEGLIDADKTIAKVQQHFQELGKVSVRGIYSDKEAVDSLDKMVVSLKNGQQEARTLTFELDKAGKAFYLTGGTSDNSGIQKLIESTQKAQDKLKALRTNLASTLKGVGRSYSDPSASKAITDSEHIKSLNAQYVHTLRAIAQLKNADDTTMASMKANANKEIATLKQMVKEFRNAEYAADALRTKDIGTVKNLQTQELDKFINKVNGSKVPLDNMTADVNELRIALANIGDKDSLTKFLNQFDTAKAKFESLKTLYQSIGGYQKQIETAISSLNQLNNSTVFRNNSSNPQVTQTKQEISNLITEYQKLYAQLQANPTSQGLETLRTELTNLDSKMKSTLQSAEAFEKQLKTDNSADQLARRVQVLKTQIEAYASANKKAQKQYGGQFNDMLSILNSNPDKTAVDSVAKQFQNVRYEINKAGLAGKTFFQKMRDDINKFTGWMSMTYAISLFTRSIREAITELKEIDILLTEISKANDKLTQSQLAEIGSNSFGIASKYGKKASDFLVAVQEMSRAGYPAAEAMGELSTAAQGAGDMTADVANQFIIAADKAYKMNGSVEELTKTLDGINYITNNNAVNMSELSEGFSIVSSTAASFGVDANELTAALGTMSATTQQSGSEVARAFRAILLNIRQVSDEEENINAEGLTKYEKACNALGVSLKEVKDGVLQLRDPMEVLKELSVEYNKLGESDLRRTELLNSVGGKLRSTQLDALLRQWDMYEDMLQQYANGSGSMAREANKICLVA